MDFNPDVIRFTDISGYPLRSIAATQHYNESNEPVISHVYTYCTKKAEIGVGGSVDLFADLSPYFKLDISRLCDLISIFTSFRIKTTACYWFSEEKKTTSEKFFSH